MKYHLLTLNKTLVLLAEGEARYVVCPSAQCARDLLQLHEAEIQVETTVYISGLGNWWDLANRDRDTRAFDFVARLKVRGNKHIPPAIRLLADLVSLS